MADEDDLVKSPQAHALSAPDRGSFPAGAESLKTAAFCANSSLTKWGKTKQNGQKVEAPLPVFSIS